MSQAASDQDTPLHPDATGPVPTPFHLWIVGVLSLLWNAFGTYDYTMTNLRDPDYLAAFPAEMITVINAMPLWAHVGWALGVWGSLLGSLLLLARSRRAGGAFALSLAGLAASTIWQQLVGLPPAMKTPQVITINVVIWAIAIGLLIYATAMARRGVLR